MREGITCTHPDRPVYCRGACKQCYYNDRNRRKRADPAYVVKERAADRTRRHANPEHFRAIYRRSYERHLDARRAYGREAMRVRRLDPEVARANVEAAVRWQRANPERVAMRQDRRRARSLSNGVFAIHSRDLRRLRLRYGGCAYCGAAASGFDHVIPIARGGRHAIGNLLPCCRRCNSSKRDRLLVEWRARRRAIAA